MRSTTLSTPAVLVGLATIAAAVWVGALLVNRVNGLSAPPYDLAFFQQVVWNVADRGLWVSSFHEGSFLGLHFSPILVIPAMIERLVGPDVRVLNLLHALAVAALIPASFLFLRALLRPSRFGPALAAVLSIGIPVWGTMQDVIRSDFHPETAGIGLALLAGWAGLTKRHRAMWALALVALATREDVSYAVAVVGLAVAVRGRGSTRRQGRFLVLVAAAWADRDLRAGDAGHPRRPPDRHRRATTPGSAAGSPSCGHRSSKRRPSLTASLGRHHGWPWRGWSLPCSACPWSVRAGCSSPCRPWPRRSCPPTSSRRTSDSSTG